MDDWDALWTLLDELVAGRAVDLAALRDHVAGAQAAGVVDRELRPEATARWLDAVAASCRALVAAGHDADEEIATMGVVVTRWLRPGRLGPLVRA